MAETKSQILKNTSKNFFRALPKSLRKVPNYFALANREKPRENGKHQRFRINGHLQENLLFNRAKPPCFNLPFSMSIRRYSKYRKKVAKTPIAL